MSRYLRVETEKNLVRDTRSSAILETDKNKLMAHRIATASRNAELNNMKERLELLEKIVKELQDKR